MQQQPTPEQIERLQAGLLSLQKLQNAHMDILCEGQQTLFQDFYEVTPEGEFDFENSMDDFKEGTNELNIVFLPPTHTRLGDGAIVSRIHSILAVESGKIFSQCLPSQKEKILLKGRRSQPSLREPKTHDKPNRRERRGALRRAL